MSEWQWWMAAGVSGVIFLVLSLLSIAWGNQTDWRRHSVQFGGSSF